MMRRRGIISTLSGSHASFDGDDLIPTSGSKIVEVKPSALMKLFSDEKIHFEQGTSVSIWGDWKGRKLNLKHQIIAINFNHESDELSIIFKDDCSVTIKEPGTIHLSKSYLKIIKAKEVRWQIVNNVHSKDEFNYVHSGKEIITNSNTNWKPHFYDIGVGMNALYLQG